MRKPLWHLRAFLRDPLTFLEKCSPQRSNAAFLRLELSWNPFYLLTDSNHLKTVLNYSTEAIDKGTTAAKLKPLLGESTLSLPTPASQERRQLVHGSFGQRELSERAITVAARISQAVATCAASKGPFKLYPWTSGLALRLVADALFGRGSLTPQDENLIISSLMRIEDDLNASMWRILPRMPWHARAQDHNFSEALSELNDVVERIRTKASDDSIIKNFVEGGLDEKAIRDEIVTYLMAGHHTTGAVAAYLIHHLAQRPDIAQKIADEADEASNAAGEIPFNALRHMPMTTAAVLETLRMYPAGWWFVREVKEPCEIGGIALPRNATIFISPWYFHRNERHWNRPNEWDPTRPLESFKTSNGFIPYGTGLRTCVGASLATLELQLIAALFCASLEMEVADPTRKIDPRPLVTLHPPSDLAVNFKIRGISDQFQSPHMKMEASHDFADCQ